ncbi:MAG: YdeI/OmpD-associated family protein [Thermomonas sp.]
MPSHDPRVDAYIAKSADFARPILEEIRARVHAACPVVEETIKWSMPCFNHAGGILCQMAAFKQHVSFGYWKHALVTDGAERDGMGSYGKLASLRDLPPKATMRADLKKAMRLNEDGVKPERRKAALKPPPETPADLVAGLKGNKAAKATFDAFPPGCRREYIEWIVEAKREETRAKRLAQAIEWMSEGKRRNWKYENC